MTLLHTNSTAANELVKALNLPENTIAFTLRMRVGEVATLEVETYVEANEEDLITAIKRYKIEEIE